MFLIFDGVSTCLPGLATRTTYASVGTGKGIALGRYELLRKLRTLGPVEHHLAPQRSGGGVERLVVINRISASVPQDRGLVEELLDDTPIAGQFSPLTLPHGLH